MLLIIIIINKRYISKEKKIFCIIIYVIIFKLKKSWKKTGFKNRFLLYFLQIWTNYFVLYIYEKGKIV